MGRLTLLFRSPVPPLLRFLLSSSRNKTKSTSCLLILNALLLLTGCASIQPVSYRPLSDQEIKGILSRIEEQDGIVDSFYTLGTVLVKNWYWEQEANSLIIGTLDPFRIKIEITHSWGQPLLHILIYETRLRVLAFRESTLYTGTYTPEALSKFIPGDLGRDLIWTTLRGYPILRDHNRIASSDAGQISLVDDIGREIEIINVYPERLLPRSVSLLGKNIKVNFSDFQEGSGIRYAREVRVENIGGKGDLILKNKKIVFNKIIPDRIFILKKPPAFKTVYLD